MTTVLTLGVLAGAHACVGSDGIECTSSDKLNRITTYPLMALLMLASDEFIIKGFYYSELSLYKFDFNFPNPKTKSNF